MDKNNFDSVLSLIQYCNERLLSDKNDNKEIIDILEKIQNKTELTEEESKKVLEVFPDIEGIIKRIYVINQLRARGISLDDEQLNVLSQFMNMQAIINEKIEKREEAILVNDEIFKKIGNNEHIDSDTLEMLKKVFLDRSSVLSLSNRIKIIEEIINYNSSGIKVNKSSDLVEEYINAKLLAEDALRELLDEYGYSYDDLDDESKIYLRKHCKLDNVKDILNTLSVYGLKLKVAKDYDIDGCLKEKEKKSINLIFCKILAYSSSKIIESLEKDFEEYEDVSFESFIYKHPNVLIPNIKGSHRTASKNSGNDEHDSTEGAFNNYKENKEFFMSKSFNFESILKTTPTILLFNSDYIKVNYEILEKIYGISFIDSKVKVEGLYEPKGLAALVNNTDTLISNIDRYIESSPKGYEYVQNNPTEPRNVNSKLQKLYRIRIAEKENKSVFYTLGKRGIVQYSANTAKDDILKNILSMGLSDAQERFDPTSKDSEGNWKPRKLFDEETIKKYKLLVTDRTDMTKEWDKDERVLNNEYISYLENNCRVDSSSIAYDYVYNINGTIISRKKVLRVFGQLMNPEVLDKNTDYSTIADEDMIKFAISYESIINEEDENNINSLMKSMNNSLGKVKSLTGGRNE